MASAIAAYSRFWMIKLAKQVAVGALGLLLGSCGGGGQAADEPAPERVGFDAPSSRTVFASGSARFRIAPPLRDGEQVRCTVNQAVDSTCLTDAGGGAVQFQGLAVGAHQLKVEVRSSAGAVMDTAAQTLQVLQPSVVVFGATPAGITAAIAATRAGQTVALIEPTRWVGGMMSGGLAKTDIGVSGDQVVGGLASEFFERVRALEALRGACTASAPCDSAYDFEPQAAEQTFEQMLAAESRLAVDRSAQLLAVDKSGAQLIAVQTSRGQVTGKVFIDASYEGDLMALAGVPFRVGREARITAAAGDAAQLAEQEDHAGTQRYRLPLGGLRVDPYRTPGDPASGVLPYIEPRPDPLPQEGEADSRVMAYTYRLCVTDDPANRLPFDRPADFDPLNYEATARVAQAWARAGADLAQTMFNPARTVRSRDPAYFKYDLNGGSTFSSDMTGPALNQAYTTAPEDERARIRQAYRSYVQGLLYAWRTDPRFGPLNAKVDRFGFCRDEFVDRGGWPHQLYVRIARRMVGEYVINENDLMQNGRRAPIADGVGFGYYNIDMHTHRYFVAPTTWAGETLRRDALMIEGFLIVHFPADRPYPVSYRALVPKAEHALNLLNPVTLSATQVAYSSLRMEPTFMVLGESAGVAAALAIERGVAVQALDYAGLREKLLSARRRLAQ